MVWLLVFMVSVWALWYHFHAKRNLYKSVHKAKLRNDRHYAEYLKWCASVGEIPMDKVDFIKEVAQRERKLNDLTK